MLGNKYNLVQKIVLVTPLIFLVGVIFYYLTPHASAASWFGEPIYKVLGNTGSGMGKITSEVWTITMNVVNSFVLALLIYVAFMNILRIQMDSYAVKKFLPTFIMTIILANFSFLIARIIIDLGNIAISIFLTGNQQNNLSGAFDELIKQKPIKPGDEGQGANYFAIINAYIFKQFFVIAGAIMMFILSFVFLVRNYMLYFLIAIAPLGFLAMALPITKKYFQQWWGTFTKWVFMPVVSVFWLWLGGKFVSAVNTGYWILPVAFGGLCLYMAITSPFKIGGAAIGAWGKLGKQAWGKTGGAAWKATGGQVGKYAKAGVKNYYDTQKDHVIRKVENTKLGKSYVGLRNKGQINRQISQFMLEKQRGDSLRGDSLQRYAEAVQRQRDIGASAGEDSASFKEAKAVVGRMKKIVGGGVGEEAKNPAWKLRTLEDIKGAMVRRKGTDGTDKKDLLRAEDMGDLERVKSEYEFFNGGAITDDKLENKGVHLFEEHASGYGETMRRARSKSLDDHEEAKDMGLPTVDMRVMASSGVPSQDSSVNATLTSEQQDQRNAQALREMVGLSPGESTGGQEGSTEDATGDKMVDYMRELVDEFRNLEQQFGGKGSLGGEGGYDQLLGEISKMKPNLTLSDAGLAAAILPVMKVRIESMDPTALEQWGRKIRQVSEGVNKMTAGIEAENASVLRQIATVIRNGANPSKLAEGRQAIGEASDTEEGEGNG